MVVADKNILVTDNVRGVTFQQVLVTCDCEVVTDGFVKVTFYVGVVGFKFVSAAFNVVDVSLNHVVISVGYFVLVALDLVGAAVADAILVTDDGVLVTVFYSILVSAYGV